MRFLFRRLEPPRDLIRAIRELARTDGSSHRRTRLTARDRQVASCRADVGRLQPALGQARFAGSGTLDIGDDEFLENDVGTEGFVKFVKEVGGISGTDFHSPESSDRSKSNCEWPVNCHLDSIAPRSAVDGVAGCLMTRWPRAPPGEYVASGRPGRRHLERGHPILVGSGLHNLRFDPASGKAHSSPKTCEYMAKSAMSAEGLRFRRAILQGARTGTQRPARAIRSFVSRFEKPCSTLATWGDDE